ncbi:Rho-binding antiterminator, partial [Erwinia amylovora]|uniref:Rho-binding antiterminator n=1 Tax=Erwinia amylovora TaxID=552 RepID=UPI0020BE12C1
MLTNEVYTPINCDDYDNLELACQNKWVLTLALKNGEQVQARAEDIVSRKNVEYLSIQVSGACQHLRL